MAQPGHQWGLSKEEWPKGQGQERAHGLCIHSGLSVNTDQEGPKK